MKLKMTQVKLTTHELDLTYEASFSRTYGRSWQKGGTPPIILQDRIFISHQRRIRAKVDLRVDVEVVCAADADA